VAIGDTAAEGTAAAIARADHRHSVAAPGAAPPRIADAGAVGVATTPARSDHTHEVAAQVQDEGVLVATRKRLNFTGAGVTASDDGAGDRITVSIPGGGGAASGLYLSTLGDLDVCNTTVETEIFSGTVAAADMAAGRVLFLEMVADWLNNTGGARSTTLRVKLGGVTILNLRFDGIGTAADRRGTIVTCLCQVVSLAAQRWRGLMVFGTSGSDAGSDSGSGAVRVVTNASAIDLTVNQTLQITVQHDLASASLCFQRRGVSVELWR
jgi:hypothetical protein